MHVPIIPALEWGADRLMPRAHPAANPAQLVSSRLSRKPRLKAVSVRAIQKDPKYCSNLPMKTGASVYIPHKHRHRHAHTHRFLKLNIKGLTWPDSLQPSPWIHAHADNCCLPFPETNHDPRGSNPNTRVYVQQQNHSPMTCNAFRSSYVESVGYFGVPFLVQFYFKQRVISYFRRKFRPMQNSPSENNVIYTGVIM